MKQKLLLLLLITYTVMGSTQSYTNYKERSPEQLKYDTHLQSSLVGVWKQSVGTYKSGIQVRYNREFALFSDSTLIRREITKLDTSIVFGYWEVVDTCIYIETIQDDTLVTLTDIVYVSYIDDTMMFLQSKFGDEELRKFSLYTRIK